MKKTEFGKNVMENVKIYKLKHNKGTESYNNRLYDPFHIFSFDYNINEIKKITQDYKEKFFPKPECFICSGNMNPRPMDCYGCEECNFYPHKRGTKTKKDLGPVMEMRRGINRKDSIYLSRPNLVWLLDHPDIEFIVRTTYANQWILHHTTLDRYYDMPGCIKIVNSEWHLDTHREFKNINCKIEKLEALLAKEENEKIEKEFKLSIKLRSMILKRLTSIDDDIDIMRKLLEIQERLKIEDAI